MATKIRFYNPLLADGEEVYISGLGTLINNKEVEIELDTQKEYEAKTGKKFTDLIRTQNFSKATTPTAVKKEGAKE